jgi:hypothetical protein
MHLTSKSLARLVGVLALLFVFALNSRAAAPDLTPLIHESQKMLQTNNEMTLVWWIPDEFWRASLMQNPETTPAKINEVMEVFRPYVIVAVVKSKFGPFGGTTYSSESAIRDNISILGKDGARHVPLAEERISEDTRNFLKMMKPMFAGMLGPMGQNFHMFVFPAKDRKGNRLASAKDEGVLNVDVTGTTFRWRLPLSAVLQSKTCSKCNDSLSGAFKFCPFDGTPLK